MFFSGFSATSTPRREISNKTFITGHRRQVKTVYGFADCLGGEDDIKFDNTSKGDITGRETI